MLNLTRPEHAQLPAEVINCPQPSFHCSRRKLWIFRYRCERHKSRFRVCTSCDLFTIACLTRLPQSRSSKRQLVSQTSYSPQSQVSSPYYSREATKWPSSTGRHAMAACINCEGSSPLSVFHHQEERKSQDLPCLS